MSDVLGTSQSAVDTISLAQPIRDGETLVSASQSFELGFFTPGNSNNSKDKKIIWSTNSSRVLENPVGAIHRFVWNWQTTEWSILFTWPFDQCDNYAQCGANNYCRINKTPICECLKGFIPKAEDEWHTQGLSQSRKCIKNLPSDCPSGEGFLKLPAIKLPDFYWYNNSMNIKECEAECFKNCSCRAYANSDDFFLRVPASELVQHYSNKKKRIKIIAVVSTITGIFILVLVLCTVWKKTKNRGLESREEEEEVPLIDLSTIAAATNNFSQANMIGKGGFGPVYKGNLSTGQEIAVKRLSNNSGQGVEEFKSEVVLIGKLQHRNLVGLLGSCIQGEERMLIYEYMPNKSLNYFIFDDERSKFLSWRKRFDIIIGIARGLLYLHQDSKLQIIHRDLKASNILLDNDLNPKISDFGLARIFRGDDKEANTKRIVGTYGYMSPEYATDGNFSLKSDVFSFGVLLLEIVSGKKNRGFRHPDHHLNLLGHAWVLWNNGRALEVKDVLAKSKFSGEEFINEVSTIGRIHHTNVVRLLGFCYEGSKHSLVYEYMPNGSLDRHIFSKKGNDQAFRWEKHHEIALGTARGIEYLHNGCDVCILHFDIKPHNILLDHNFIPKVVDFGLAKFHPKENDFICINATRGTIGYIAPELIFQEISA
ncbi:hypothetical protein Q3G72_028605 [Acer saccharum]|nr:hypothetical protein Q3G72_028605 [Acer saccharum]